MFRKVLLTVAVAAVTMPLMQVHAQQSGSANVSAIVAEHIVLSGNEDLVFPGSLARGQNAAVSATDEAANAKRTLVCNRSVAVSFGVPTSLTSAGGDQLPITLYVHTLTRETRPEAGPPGASAPRRACAAGRVARYGLRSRCRACRCAAAAGAV